jgi:heat shock protein HtpX
MGITATRLTSQLRTWLLITGLTALMIAIGAILGGAFLWLFVLAAVGFNVVGYFQSDRIALRAARARRLADDDVPEIHAALAELAARAGIPVPALYIIPGEQPNAFATGRNPEHAAVALTDGLITHMATADVRAVMAHEIAHIANRDILVSSVAATISGAIGAAVNLLSLSFLFGGEDSEENPLGPVGTLAALLLAPLAGSLLTLGVSRQREYLADATAARLLGSGAPLADALASIEATAAPALAVPAATAPMYIVNPFAATSLTGLLSTHPPVSERIRRLRAYSPRHLSRV